MAGITDNYHGQNTVALMAQEATFGTDPGAGYVAMGILDGEISITRNNTLKRLHALGSRTAQQIVPTQYIVTGTITGIYQTGRLLTYAMGRDSRDGVTVPPTHYLNYRTIAASPVDVSLLPSFTLRMTRGNVVTADTIETYTGCRITSFRLSGTMDEPLRISCDFIGQTTSDSLTAAASVFAVDADTVQPPQFGSFQIPDATALGQVQNFELTINNNLAQLYAVGSRLLQQSPALKMELDLRSTIAFTDESAARIQAFLGDAVDPFTPQNTITAETATILYTNAGAAAALRSIRVNLSNVRIGEMAHVTRVGEVTFLDLTSQIQDFTQTGWGAVPSNAPIVLRDEAAAAYVTTTP